MKFLYDFLKLIPKWKVITYKQLGEIFNLHPRKVALILKQNTKQNEYPCYKVVNSDLTIGGYNLWEKEKINRLLKDNIQIINNKISSENIWKPKFKNFFCAFPLEGLQKENFQKLVNELEKINNNSFSLQKADTPHITLRFFWDLSLENFHKIIESSKNLKINKKIYITLSNINNFNQKVYFYKPDSRKELESIYLKFNEINNLSPENREYNPHLTLFRVKNIEQLPLDKIYKITEKYKCFINLNTIRFYLAVDNDFQIPIADVYLY